MTHRCILGFRRAFPEVGAWIIVVGCLLATPVRADDDSDKNRAPAKSEKIATMSEVVTHVHKNFDGQVLKIKLRPKKDAPGWRYKVKILMPEGNVIEADIDATSLEVLEIEGDESEEGFFQRMYEKTLRFFSGSGD
ncbi:MAG: hypothetical protein A2516_07340 [Alphaproteobacteria bacterium RIFOXYD12_FULL_60_8]|nr:MAG: hypothetical protein A2516_07340 [Alphaproteobacteria bacterium RIFOXYD12_FULL_60_8]